MLHAVKLIIVGAYSANTWIHFSKVIRIIHVMGPGVDFLTFRTARPPLWVIISRCAPRGQLTRVCWRWHFFINAICNSVSSRLAVPRTLRARHPSTGITGCSTLTNLSGMIVHAGFSSLYPHRVGDSFQWIRVRYTLDSDRILFRSSDEKYRFHISIHATIDFQPLFY